MNNLNKVISNNSDSELIKIKLIKEPISSINKEISQSKQLLEKFFKKLNDDITSFSGYNKNDVLFKNHILSIKIIFCLLFSISKALRIYYC